MTKGGATYFGLLAMLRQNELLDEAQRNRLARLHQSRRRTRVLHLGLPRRRAR